MDEHYITDVSVEDDGVLIELDHVAKYLIEPGDTSTASLWYGSQRVKLSIRSGSVFNITILNLSVQLGRKSVNALLFVEKNDKADG